MAMDLKNRVFFKEPKKIKLWKLKYNSLTRDVPQEIRDIPNHNNDITIIDFGAWFTRAGLASQKDPSLIFKTSVSKTKKDKIDIIQVGNMIREFEYHKAAVRSPYDKGILTDIALLENTTDYIFKELNFRNDFIETPQIYTEPLLNPSKYRNQILQLFFEGYNIPRVQPVVDTFASIAKTLKSSTYSKLPLNNGFIVDIGHSQTHVIPLMEGKVCFNEIRRINIGTIHILDTLSKYLTQKYSHIKEKQNVITLQVINNQFCHCALDYKAQLEYYKYGVDAFRKDHVYQHPLVKEYGNYFMEEGSNQLKEPIFQEFYETETEKIFLESEMLRKRELRKEQAERIREAMVKKRDEKKHLQVNELNKFEKMIELKDENPDWVQSELEKNELNTLEELQKRIKKMKLKMGLISQEELDKDRYSLIQIPDNELTKLEVKQKRMQVMQKQAAEQRIITKERKRVANIELEKQKSESPKLYLSQLYDRRKNIKDKIRNMKQFKEDTNIRKSKNMKMLTILDNYQDGKVSNYEQAENEIDMMTKEMRDINSDVENYETKLVEVESEIRQFHPDFDDEMTNYANLFKVANQIDLGVDAVRPAEILFQPIMIGVDQMGLSELLINIADKFSSDYKTQLLSNIYISGGGAQVKDIGERIKYDIQNEFEKPVTIKIGYSQNPILDSWHGLKTFSSNTELFNKYSVSKAEYEEQGENAFKSFCLSNNN